MPLKKYIGDGLVALLFLSLFLLILYTCIVIPVYGLYSYKKYDRLHQEGIRTKGKVLSKVYKPKSSYGKVQTSASSKLTYTYEAKKGNQKVQTFTNTIAVSSYLYEKEKIEVLYFKDEIDFSDIVNNRAYYDGLRAFLFSITFISLNFIALWLLAGFSKRKGLLLLFTILLLVGILLFNDLRKVIC